MGRPDVAPAMTAAVGGKKVLHACALSGDMLEAWKRAKAYDKRYGLGGKFKESRRTVEFKGGGFVMFRTLRSAADGMEIKGIWFDEANEHAMAFDAVRAQVSR